MFLEQGGFCISKPSRDEGIDYFIFYSKLFIIIFYFKFL